MLFLFSKIIIFDNYLNLFSSDLIFVIRNEVSKNIISDLNDIALQNLGILKK